MATVRIVPTSVGSNNTGWDAEGSVTAAKVSTDDGATTALYSPTSGHIISFNMTAHGISSGATINSVTVGNKVLKLDPVSALTRTILRVGSTNYEGSNFDPTTNGAYQETTTQYTTNPATSAAWTVSDLSSIQAGIKKENSAGERVTYIYIDIDYTDSTPVTPVANFTATPTSGTVPLTVSFTDTSTNSPTSWEWTTNLGTFSTSQNPTFEFTSTGTYDVTLYATNAAGTDSEAKTAYITVTEPPSPLTIIQSKTGNSGTSYVNSSTITFDDDVTAGSDLFLTIATTAAAANDVTTVTDNRSNTWVKAISAGGNNRTMDIWYVENANAGATTITVASTSYTQKSFAVTETDGAPSPLTVRSTVLNVDGDYTNTHYGYPSTAYLGDMVVYGYAGSVGDGVYTASGTEGLFTGGGDTTNATQVLLYDPANYQFTLDSTEFELGVSALMVLAPPLENRLPDPSMETAAVEWGAYGGTYTYSTTYAHTGTYSLRLAATEVWGGAYYILDQPSAATLQSFKIWIRGDGTSSGKKVNAVLKNETTGETIKSTDVTLSTSWQEAEVTYTPSEPCIMSVQVQGVDLAGGYVYIDDGEMLGLTGTIPTIEETFTWKGYDWQRRANTTYGHTEPMFNGAWSQANVLDPDLNGITLRLSNASGTNPIGAEMRTVQQGFGYGTYTSVVDTQLDTMHPSVVFGGMFLFDEGNPPAWSEIDVHESSAWGNTRPTDFDGVQLMHNMWRPSLDGLTREVEDTWIDMPSAPVQTHRLIWEPGKMTVDSFIGEGTHGELIMHHEFTNVPVPGDERVHYNIWVVGGGTAPEEATPIDVTIRDFQFTPMETPTGNYVTNDWHEYGTQPSKTTSELRTLAREKYDEWFSYTLTSLGLGPTKYSPQDPSARRIKVPDQGFYLNPDYDGTVSEGMGYGLLLKAWFSNPDLGEGIYDPSAKSDFDALYRYVQAYTNSNGLMNWNITYQGDIADTGSATDGDLDIAMALIIMSRLHESGLTIDYAGQAAAMLDAILANDFVPATGTSGSLHANLLMNGDQWGVETDSFMPDYFRSAFIREFYAFSGNTRWLDILTANYLYAIDYYYDNYDGGLVPDRQTRTHGSLGAETDKATYNSVRLGFGISLDYLWNGSSADPLSALMMNKLANKAKANFTTGSNVKAPPYDLDFTEWETYSNLAGYGLIGPAAVVHSSNQTFATQILDAMDASSEFSSSYFNGGIGLMAIMVMSGIAQPHREPVTTNVSRWNGTAWVPVEVNIISN